MKKTFKIALFLSLVLLHAMESKSQQPPSFSAKEASGIFIYDVDKVMKKLKIEDSNAKQSITKAISEYNLQMYQMADEHTETFEELDTYFNSQVKIAMQRRDRSQMDGVKAKIQQTIPPIRKEVMEYEKALNIEMETILDQKQNKKWLSYQKSQKPSSPAGMGG